MEKKPKKELTELQEKFLDALFGEAAGNPSLAKKIAGYSPNVRPSEIVNTLSDEIVERSKKFLGLNSAKAVFALLGTLDNPSQAGAMNLIKAATEILNRSGVKEEKEAGDAIPESGIVILPTKNTTITISTNNEDTSQST